VCVYDKKRETERESVCPCMCLLVLLYLQKYTNTYTYLLYIRAHHRTGHGTGYNHPTRVSTGSRRPSMSASYLLDDNNGKIE
jgi:hypothetical protein